MTALDLNRPPTPTPSAPIIYVDSRAVTPAETFLLIGHEMARAQLTWVGFRHPAIIDPIVTTETTQAGSTWAGLAEALFPRSRTLTADEAKEIDATILKGAAPIGRKRQY
jgi:hypothetical protein